MKKKQKKWTQHFVPNKARWGGGIPACNGFQCKGFPTLEAFSDETAKTRRGVTCGNCRRTRVFRKLK